MNISILEAIGLVSAVVIPWLVWEWRKTAMIHKLLDMHEEPDKYGFGTESTNAMLLAQTKALRDVADDQRRSTDQLTSAVQALTHYIKWLSRQQTGVHPPPHLPPDR